ncbi:T9SS type A sorting domain-containing protein [Hymenobacter sp. ASUV-10]|uniref:T9SS type A sorting domain-containing protein n=1 Tax=Hymenobacter aranciens TaxID=3063996 RepID=A0ABT9BDH5_9BACT|nr:T9SS type A sorting domain-containing protein [Hymenobacter sp. ASUV-10]MDO7874588.1 T9SS type A sorting domain-containing protein [Hymenobacter sp. ASUV-10]
MRKSIYSNWGKHFSGAMLLASGLLLASRAEAQVDTYTFTPSTGAYTPLTGGTGVSSIEADDAYSGTIPLGFSFVFDGSSYSECIVSSNGWLSFNMAAASSNLSNDLDNGNATERPRIAPFWDDLDGGNGSSTASYATTGTAPNRVFTFEWRNWERFFEPGTFSMQVQLFEGTNQVRLVYERGTTPLTTATASIGLSGIATGSCASFLSLSDASATPTASGTTENDNIADTPATGQVYSFVPGVAAACPTPRCLSAVTTATGATLSFSVSNANPGPFTLIYGPTGFNPATGGTTLTLTTTTTTIGGLTPATGYQFYVTQNCGGIIGSSPISAAEAFTTNQTPPVNDDCAGALDVPIQYGSQCISQTSADNSAATDSPNVPAPGCAQYMGQDLWFKVTVPASGELTVKTVDPTAGSNITDTGMAIYSGTCGNLALVDCDDDGAGGAKSLIEFTGATARTPGEVLYIRVWDYNGGQNGLLAVCATAPSNCPLPTAPAAANLTNTTADLSWVATGTTNPGDTFEIEYGVSGYTLGTGTAVNGLTSTSYQLANLLPDTEYCFYVRQNCGPTNGSSSWVGPTCFRTPLTVPDNDEPCGALPLASTSGAVGGTTIGATTSQQTGISLPACSPAGAPKDVWFVFTLGANATSTTLNLTGTTAGMVRLFTAPDCTGGPFVQVGCAAATANNAGFAAPVTFTGLVAGQRYWLAVSGFGSSDVNGAFTVSATNTVLGTRAAAAAGELAVYPNPSNTGELTLRVAGAQGAGSAALVNALGQVVRQVAVAAGSSEQRVSTRGLAAGVYTLRLTVGQRASATKVVLQ